MRTPDKHLQLLLIAVVGFNILPHTLQQPPWLIAVSVLALLWTGLNLYRNTKLPSKHMRSVLAIAAFIAVIAQWGTMFGQEPASGLLVILGALKLLETTRYRDAMLVIFTSYFLLMAYLLVDQSLFSTLYMALDVSLITALMFHLHKSDRRSSIRSFRPVMRLLATSLPVWIFLFVVFPRFSTGFWSLKTTSGAQTGFSDQMNPGDVERLLENDEVAFRAVFPQGRIGSPEDMYWRGGTLYYANKGLSWTRPGYAQLTDVSERPYAQPEDDRRIVNYEIYLEPLFKRWLFTLDTPIDIEFSDPLKNAGIIRRSGFLFESNRDVSTRTRYSAVSTRSPRTVALAEDRRLVYLQLPEDASQAVVALAQRLKSESDGSVKGIIDRTLRFYDEEKFTYTRNPGVLKTGEISEFLFESKKGFCEHYAGSFATLMRVMGIPSRVVIGFLGGQINGFGNYVIVRNLDAHAWSEVWDDSRQTWVRVDPTAMIAPLRLQMGGLYHEENRAANSLFGNSSIYRLQRRLDLAWDAAAMQWNQFLLGYDFDYQQRIFERFGLKEASRLVFFIWCGIGLMAFASILHFFLKWKAKKEEPLLAAYHDLCTRLEKFGVKREPNEGPRSFFAKAKRRHPSHSETLKRIEEEFIELRYGKLAANDVELKTRVKRFAKDVRKVQIKNSSAKSLDFA